MTRAAVAALAESWAGVSMEWTNAPNLSSLETWAKQTLAGHAPPLPTVAAATTLICYELPLLAARRAGMLDDAALAALYARNLSSHQRWVQILNGNLVFGPTEYQRATQSPLPVAGDLVFIDGMGHVGLATGRVSLGGDPLIVSFWGFSPIPTAAGRMSVTTPVTVDSAVALAEIVDAARRQVQPGALPVPITFTSPPW